MKLRRHRSTLFSIHGCRNRFITLPHHVLLNIEQGYVLRWQHDRGEVLITVDTVNEHCIPYRLPGIKARLLQDLIIRNDKAHSFATGETVFVPAYTDEGINNTVVQPVFQEVVFDSQDTFTHQHLRYRNPNQPVTHLYQSNSTRYIL